MAHFAEIDENNIVIRVVVTDNNDSNGDEGYQWLVDNLGGKWAKTSYNATFGKKFAGVGDIYVPSTGNFKAPQPFESWRWSANQWAWIPPVEYPNDDKVYAWNEATTNWIEII